MASMGMNANIFSNHIFYWGDQHRDQTLGPERGRGNGRMRHRDPRRGSALDPTPTLRSRPWVICTRLGVR